jgi:hypothetical protein
MIILFQFFGMGIAFPVYKTISRWRGQKRDRESLDIPAIINFKEVDS